MLSGYRIMWVIALFDLPVGTKKERKLAAKFRKHLMDLGFEMVQFSVYARHSFSKERVQALIPKISAEVPANGDVKILSVTDKQFENIIHLGKKGEKPMSKDQLVLF